MDIFVGRQPIFNVNQQLYGYELLNRSGGMNEYQELDGDKATMEVLANSFLGIGINKLSNGKRCFVNFTEKLIIEDFPLSFNRNTIVVELLEDIRCTQEVLDACARLKAKGYTIALDDYVFLEQNKPLLQYADIIKIDFLLSNVAEIVKLKNEIAGKNIFLLAEKVETRETFELAKTLGFQLFQGYFFSKPVVINAKDVPAVNNNYYTLFDMIDRADPNINEIADAIERDFSLTYKLLRMVNSTAYQLKKRISSVKQAIMILGLYELRKLVMVLAFTANTSKEKEVVKLSLCRAKFCESIANLNIEGRKTKASEYFLLGLFSLIDTILERPMENILSDLPLTVTVKEALQGKPGELSMILNLLHALEKCNIVETRRICEILHWPYEEVIGVYLNSIEWSDSLFEMVEQ